MALPVSHARVVDALRSAGCVFAEEEARLLVSEARSAADLDAMVERRAAGMPLEYVLGWAEFCGLRIAVEPGVFVPRRRTELLVRQAAALAPAAATVVDLCCGTGAIGAALLARLDGAAVCASDLDPVAVRCARRNLPAGSARVVQGDLFEPLPDTLLGSVDILVANVPYVPTDEVRLLPGEARLHEPRVALDGGDDGLEVALRVVAEAPRWLAPGGHLLVETSESQAPVLVAACGRSGLAARAVTSAEVNATVVIATQPTSRVPAASG